MKICNKCILNDNYRDISFNEAGTCSLCVEQRTYVPFGEDKLMKIIDEAKKKNCSYDALVPISGGKDSTYILYLAVKVYKLKVLTMTYDNGLFSQIALDNIQQALKITNVKHITCKPDAEVQKKIYRNMFLKSGDICGACDIGTKANILKVAHDYSVPIILYGTSPLEEDSFIPDSIQDIARFKYILKKSNDLTRKEINDFLIYPNLNLFLLSYYKRTGKFGREVRPFFYIDSLTDKEMGDIITKELNWKEDNSREYSKHFDCIAEPLTNYVRNKIYGYERRICQYSNMIRRNEMSREKALELYEKDDIASKPANYKDVLKYLNLSDDDLQAIVNIPKLKYEKHTSKLNRLFVSLMKIKQM
jgi:tRNA(Ile)-lysidine synthase TilS/MesJ